MNINLLIDGIIDEIKEDVIFISTHYSNVKKDIRGASTMYMNRILSQKGIDVTGIYKRMTAAIMEKILHEPRERRMACVNMLPESIEDQIDVDCAGLVANSLYNKVYTKLSKVQ